MGHSSMRWLKICADRISEKFDWIGRDAVNACAVSGSAPADPRLTPAAEPRSRFDTNTAGARWYGRCAAKGKSSTCRFSVRRSGSRSARREERRVSLGADLRKYVYEITKIDLDKFPCPKRRGVEPGEIKSQNILISKRVR